MADFMSGFEVLYRYRTLEIYPGGHPDFSKLKHEEIEVLPRALGYGVPKNLPDVDAAKHAYCGLDCYLEYPVMIKLQEDIPQGQEIVKDDDLGKSSGIVHFSLHRQGDDTPLGEIAEPGYVYHWSICVQSTIANAKLLFSTTPTSKDAFIEKQAVWYGQLRRGRPWQPFAALCRPMSRPTLNGQPAPFVAGELYGKLPIFKEYKVTKKLLKLINKFMEANPRDILSTGQIIFAIFVWDFLKRHLHEIPQDMVTTYPISQPPLTHFIIYFIEFLKRTEIYRLVYYTHPYRFVSKAYEHDTRRDEKYSISPTSISETEVEEEMRKISPTVVDSFYPSDVEASLIPPFVPDPQNSDIPAFNATQALIGPIGQWTWHDYDNLPAKDVTHHLLYPRSFGQPRIVKGEYTATEEIHQYRIKRVLVDGIFLYTMSRPSLTPALVSALEQRSMKLPLLLTFQRPAADASRSEIVQAVALACNPKPAAATLFKNDEAVECHTAKTLQDYAVSLLSSVTRLNHAVLLLAGYVVDPDKLSSHQIVRNDHGRWLIDGLVPDKTRPLNDIEADELRQAVESLYESTQVPNVLGVTIGRCVAGVMDDDAEKRRFTLKILMQLCFPMTSYALYVMLFLHVIYAENCNLKSADALHLYRNLLLFQEIKNDLGRDPPKPYCHVVLATAVQYLPETASRIKGLEKAMNSKMGAYVHESLKDIFWRTYGWRYQ